MGYLEIAQLIQEKFEFVKAPSQNEVQAILRRITPSTTEEEFKKIVFGVVKNTDSYIFESLDMSASKNILLQIKAELSKSRQNGS